VPETRLQKTRATLPEGYQFGDASNGAHAHSFNAISGYCECGLQYAPHLVFAFPYGGVVKDYDGTIATRFITRLGNAR